MKALILAAFLAANAAAQPGPAKWKELNSEGIRLVGAADHASAEQKFRAALVEAEQFGEEDFRLWATLSNLASTLQELGGLAEAEKLFRRVIQLRERYMAPESAEIAAALNNLAATLHSAGRNTEADPLLRSALLIAEGVHEDKTTAAVLNTLGLVLMAMDEFARAEPVMRRSEALFEKAEGPGSFNVAKVANNLATLYAREGEFIKAEEQERLAMPIYEKNLPPDHPLLGVVANNMFTILGAEKRVEEAEPYLRRALAIAGRTPDGIRIQQVRANLASFEASRGNWQAAADILQKVIAAEERLLGPEHPGMIPVLANYSEALKHLHHKAEAKQTQRRIDAILTAFRP